MGIATVGELKQSMSGKRLFRPNSSIRHAAQNEFFFNLANFCRPISDVSSDLIIEVGTSTFSLHRFPHVSRSGRFRKLMLEAKDQKVARVTLHGIPGGLEAFEIASKFCYGVNVDINLSNVAMIRCVSQYLEMTEELADKNLEIRCENFLKETVLSNISNSISVLHCCESLLPVAEEINMVSKIINSIAINVCKEQLTTGLSRLEQNFLVNPMNVEIEPETPLDWWGNLLTVLNLDFFRRVISGVKSKGLKQETTTKILINYAHNSLEGQVTKDIQMVKGSLTDTELQKKQRMIVETIFSLLPAQSRKSSVPLSFLSGLLKITIMGSCSAACKADIERRIGLKLDQAIIEDILIPANAPSNNQQCIPGSPKQSSIIKVSKLFDTFLAEIALDSYLTPSKFIALAELLPNHARVVNDGLYRAADIFRKVHSNIKESEQYRLCKTIYCQKLSQEACSHAAQNERLPVQMAVQVLYFEQIRLKNAMNGSQNQLFFGSMNGQFPQHSSSGAGSEAISPRDNYASVRRENRELKLEVSRMSMRLTDLEKDHVSMKKELIQPNSANKLLKAFKKQLRLFNSLFRIREIKLTGSRSGSELDMSTGNRDITLFRKS
ncbi:hypothetical protein MKX01_023081 [Papaver californicum]|nr:hypothetical protein MKX01_023081 [Papaver californicum]